MSAMGPLLKIIGLLVLLGGLGLASSAYGDGSVFGMGLALVVFAIGAYALVASSRENLGGGPPPAQSVDRPTPSGPRPSGPGAALKTCPDCAESVNGAARKCRYCGYMFEESTIITPVALSSAMGPTPTAPASDTGDAPAVPDAVLEGPRGMAAFLAYQKGIFRHGPLGPNGLAAFSPLAVVAGMRAGLWNYGHQWCSRCGESLQPQISAAGVIDPLFKCTACGTLHRPATRRR